MGGEYLEEAGHHHDDQGEGDEGTTQGRERQGETKLMSFLMFVNMHNDIIFSNIIYTVLYQGEKRIVYSMCIFYQSLL